MANTTTTERDALNAKHGMPAGHVPQWSDGRCYCAAHMAQSVDIYGATDVERRVGLPSEWYASQDHDRPSRREVDGYTDRLRGIDPAPCDHGILSDCPHYS